MKLLPLDTKHGFLVWRPYGVKVGIQNEKPFGQTLGLNTSAEAGFNRLRRNKWTRPSRLSGFMQDQTSEEQVVHRNSLRKGELMNHLDKFGFSLVSFLAGVGFRDLVHYCRLKWGDRLHGGG